MIEYVLLVAVIVICYGLFQNKFLRSKRWFSYLSAALAAPALVYLVLTTDRCPGYLQIILLAFTLNGIFFTAMKRVLIVKRGKQQR